MKTSDDFNKRECVLTHHDGLHSPTRARGLPQFRQSRIGFSLSQHKQFETFLGEIGSADLPVAQMRGDQEDSFAAGLGRLVNLPAPPAHHPIVEGHPPFVPQKVGDFQRKFSE